MLQAILTWSSFEYSSLLMCLPHPDRRKKFHQIFLIRLLATDSEGMSDVRADAINIGSQASRESMFHEFLVERWKASFFFIRTAEG